MRDWLLAEANGVNQGQPCPLNDQSGQRGTLTILACACSAVRLGVVGANSSWDFLKCPVCCKATLLSHWNPLLQTAHSDPTLSQSTLSMRLT